MKSKNAFQTHKEGTECTFHHYEHFEKRFFKGKKMCNLNKEAIST